MSLLAVKTLGSQGSRSKTGGKTGRVLYDKCIRNFAHSVRRGAAIDRSGEDVILVARTEGLLGEEGFHSSRTAIGRLSRFRGCRRRLPLRARVRDKDDIAALVRAVQPKPAQCLDGGARACPPRPLADLGVRRHQCGGGALAARSPGQRCSKASEQIANKVRSRGRRTRFPANSSMGIFAKV
jgi:2-methylisocitrate lyase-like PEP mutase family enzyme